MEKGQGCGGAFLVFLIIAIFMAALLVTAAAIIEDVLPAVMLRKATLWVAF